jgi:hypothetical protein
LTASIITCPLIVKIATAFAYGSMAMTSATVMLPGACKAAEETAWQQALHLVSDAAGCLKIGRESNITWSTLKTFLVVLSKNAFAYGSMAMTSATVMLPGA